MKILYTPNMRHVYLAGDVFGEQCYIVAENIEDAWEEFGTYRVDLYGPCDHGGDITDEQRMVAYSDALPTAESVHWNCDCSLLDNGKWFNDLHTWVRELAVPVDRFMLVADDLEKGP
ncbi:MAG: hypothetical protein KDH16_22725 [Rhodocyclaceae bacterium]|nr:hypothetical protein [Rhodocyclaceae bacterium]